MIRRMLFSLVSLAATFAMLGTAQAGTFVYDWVTPSFGNGVHFSGLITVDSTGISSTPISLTSSMIQAWQISVRDSTNTVLFSLSSATDSLLITTDSVIGTVETVAPKITTTSIFLPALSGGSAVDSYEESFVPMTPIFDNPSVGWTGTAGLISLTSVTVLNSTGLPVAEVSGPNREIEIAHNPEPASLVIWSLAAGVFGVWRIRKRRRLSVEAA